LVYLKLNTSKDICIQRFSRFFLTVYVFLLSKIHQIVVRVSLQVKTLRPIKIFRFHKVVDITVCVNSVLAYIKTFRFIIQKIIKIRSLNDKDILFFGGNNAEIQAIHCFFLYSAHT
jgi:hypothetical protein